VDSIITSGKLMSGTTVKVDEKGRIIIPKGIRKIPNLKEGTCLSIKAEGKKIVIEPIEPVADKYFGAFKIAKWPEDIDEFTVEDFRCKTFSRHEYLFQEFPTK
jgi:AbrB family looped-hinge helix DNA binding protein